MQLVNGDGETVTCVAEGKREVLKLSLMRLTNSLTSLFSFCLITSRVTDGIDSQARVLVAVENTDTDTIFNSSGIDFDVLRLVLLLISCQYFYSEGK